MHAQPFILITNSRYLIALFIHIIDKFITPLLLLYSVFFVCPIKSPTLHNQIHLFTPFVITDETFFFLNRFFT
jgi:hypothetical protein